MPGVSTAVEIVRSAAVEAHGNILAAFTTYPPLSRLFVALSVSMMAAAVALLPTAMLSGFVQREKRRPRQTLPRGVKLRALAGTFFVPGLLEETVFRAAMLPRLHDNYGDLPSGVCLMVDQSAASLNLSRLTLALIVFVGMHPVNGMLLRKEAKGVFCDWRFLSCAAVLGAICSMLYLETGTIWAPAVVHWIVVAVWLWEFDGLERMGVVSGLQRGIRQRQ